MAKKKTHYCEMCCENKPADANNVPLPNGRIICTGCKKKYKGELKVYRIGCRWEAISHYEIPARSLEEAISIADDPASPLPPDPDYVPDSFRILRDTCEEMEGEEIG